MSTKEIQAEFEIQEPHISIPTFEVVDDNGVKKVEILGFDDPEVSPQEILGREVTVRKAIVLGNGRININELTAYVESKVNAVSSLDVANADESDVKKAQAELNKLSKELNDNRIALEKEWKAPFEKFIANPVKTLVAKIDKAKKPIADKLNSINDAWTKERTIEIEEIKDERLAKESEEVDKYIRTLSWFFDEKWLNKGSWGSNGKSPQKIITQIDSMVSKIVSDIEVIGMMNEYTPFCSQLMDVYRINGGDLAKSLLKKKELEDAALAYEKMQAEQKARKEAEKAEQDRLEAEAKEKREQVKRELENASPLKEEPSISIGNVPTPSYLQPESDLITEVDLPPVEPEKNKAKIYITTFKVKSTYEELALIAGYMKQINVKSKMIESIIQEAE